MWNFLCETCLVRPMKALCLAMSSSKVFQKVSPGSGGIRTHAPEETGALILPDKGSSDNISEMSSNVELHSQSRRSSMTFGPIASKCFNISSQSKRAILNIFLTFVTFDQPEYRGMSTARFRVSPLSIKLPNRAEGVRKSDIIFGGVSEVKKVQD